MAGMRRVVLCGGASTDILGVSDGDGLQDPPRWQAVAISCSPLEGDCRQSVDKTTPGPIGPAFFFCFSWGPLARRFFFLVLALPILRAEFSRCETLVRTGYCHHSAARRAATI